MPLKYELLFIIQNVLLFFVLFLILYLVFKDKKKEYTVKKRSIYSNLPPKTIVAILIAAAGLTFVASRFTVGEELVIADILSGVAIYVLLISLAPYIILGQIEKNKREAIFDDVVLYCQNMAVLLKQTHDVYNSLLRVRDDLTTVFKDDVNSLIIAFENGKEATLEAMRQMEKNYKFSCINNLNIVLIHMNYEKAEINDSLIINFQEDLEQLEKDVRDNNSARKGTRTGYIAITVIAIVGYYYFCGSLQPTFPDVFESTGYKIINIVFLFASLITLFVVDNYYSKNTTKE